MPIVYPSLCRNVTAGALRQIKNEGFTSASGGLFEKRFVLNNLHPKLVFLPTEPAGVFMETLDRTVQQLGENKEAIANAARSLVDTAKDANKQMSDVTGKFRDGTEKLGNAIDKLMKVAGRGDFAETVKLTESLVNSLERLAVLDEKGLLDKVMKAMRA